MTTRIIAVFVACACGPAFAQEGGEVKPAGKPEAGAGAAKAAPILLAEKDVTPGCRLFSRKLRQVACVNGYAEEGTSRTYSLEMIGMGGEAHRSLDLDSPRGGKAEGILKRANDTLVEGGFERMVEQRLGDEGTRGPVVIEELNIKAEVTEPYLTLLDRKGKPFFKKKLQATRPHVPRLVAFAVIPGTRSVAFTLVNDPGDSYGKGFNLNWESLIVVVK